MAFLALFLLMVVPGTVQSIVSLSDFIAIYRNWCPSAFTPFQNGSEQTNLTNPCCAFCDSKSGECTKYGTCCLGQYGSFETARESVSQTL